MDFEPEPASTTRQRPEATASTCPPCVHHDRHGLVQHDVAVVAVHVRLAIGRRRARPRGDLVPRPVVPFRGHGVCCALVVAPLGHRGPPRRAPRAPRGPVDELATGRPLGRRRRAAAVVQGGVSHATEPDARGRGGLRHHGAHGRGRRRGPRGAAQDRGAARPRGRPEHGVLRRRSGSPRGPRARRARRARLLVAGPRQPPRRRLPPRRRRPGRQRVVPPRADPRPPEFRRKFRISEHPSRRRARARGPLTAPPPRSRGPTSTPTRITSRTPSPSASATTTCPRRGGGSAAATSPRATASGRGRSRPRSPTSTASTSSSTRWTPPTPSWSSSPRESDPPGRAPSGPRPAPLMTNVRRARCLRDAPGGGAMGGGGATGAARRAPARRAERCGKGSCKRIARFRNSCVALTGRPKYRRKLSRTFTLKDTNACEPRLSKIRTTASHQIRRRGRPDWLVALSLGRPSGGYLQGDPSGGLPGRVPVVERPGGTKTSVLTVTAPPSPASTPPSPRARRAPRRRSRGRRRGG